MDPALRDYVLARDGGCVAALANSAFWSSRWPMLQGLPDPGPCAGRLTLDHVKDGLRLGRRAPDDPGHLWAVCVRHHLGTLWSSRTPVREAARAYIAAANEAAARNRWPLYAVPAERGR